MGDFPKSCGFHGEFLIKLGLVDDLRLWKQAKNYQFKHLNMLSVVLPSMGT